MGNESSKPKRAVSQSSRRRRSPPPDIKVASPSPLHQHTFDDESDGRSSDPNYLPSASFSRPPRLPLPIEEEVHTPGSPILSFSDPTAPVDIIDPDDVIGRRSSNVSSTVDDEEEPDGFQGYMPNIVADVPKVSTVIEWRDAAPTDRVYVTGTFTDWQKKIQATSERSKQARKHSFRHAAITAWHTSHQVFGQRRHDLLKSSSNHGRFYQHLGKLYRDCVGQASSATARRTPPPHQTPQKVAASPKPARASPAPTPPPSKHSPAPPTIRQPPKEYTNQIPAFLLDLDTWPAQSDSDQNHSPDQASAASRFQRANAAIAHLPAPPSLPLFLNKSILNGATPMKDDSSVLIMPNHTVLNHLATTNIKQGVLATSSTTRYKNKFLTTIMYKPRNEDTD